MDAGTAGLTLGIAVGVAECVGRAPRLAPRVVIRGVAGGFASCVFLGAPSVAEGIAVGFFGWAGVRLMAAIVDLIRRHGPWGDDGGGGGGGGGGWDPPEDPAPWGPGPTDFEPECAGTVHTVGSSLTMDDFARETEANPAPVEPDAVPVGRG